MFTGGRTDNRGTPGSSLYSPNLLVGVGGGGGWGGGIKRL